MSPLRIVLPFDWQPRAAFDSQGLRPHYERAAYWRRAIAGEAGSALAVANIGAISADAVLEMEIVALGIAAELSAMTSGPPDPNTAALKLLDIAELAQQIAEQARKQAGEQTIAAMMAAPVNGEG